MTPEFVRTLLLDFGIVWMSLCPQVMLKQYKRRIGVLEARLADYEALREDKATIQAQYAALLAKLAEFKQKEEERQQLQVPSYFVFGKNLRIG